MPDRGERFRRLRTPRTGDLFEHFGVPATVEPAPEPGAMAPVVSAAACDGCGWYRALPVRGPCPLCGAPGREANRPTSSDSRREAG
ncbi:hypothetical protein [Paraliomyxa miuraensis]|uniref:hypothetical protein n=1 Tax=Paraliomyxa miuraensis TaxID=376150 RepID=UPI002251EE25|nr:hypothetical protein [Paraliomyxa miuraensis]MCX4243210.1 hypothetical protein [Paraliomyxa miuraensis]